MDVYAGERRKREDPDPSGKRRRVLIVFSATVLPCNRKQVAVRRWWSLTRLRGAVRHVFNEEHSVSGEEV
jgi:hypothetical protein